MESDLSMARRRQKFLIKWGAIGLSLVALYLLAFIYVIDRRPFVEWTLIKGAPDEVVASSQLIKMPDGKVILINAGQASGSLLPFLKKQKIKDIDLVLLTSTAPRNISALEEMVVTGVRIKEIKTSPQSQKSPAWEEVQNKLLNRGVKIQSVTQKEKLYLIAKTELSAISSHDNSMLIQLKHGVNSLLLVMGETSGFIEKLTSESCEELKSDILINYSEPQSDSQKLKIVECSRPSLDLSRELGTFKILLKGDSFRWKRGR